MGRLLESVRIDVRCMGMCLILMLWWGRQWILRSLYNDLTEHLAESTRRSFQSVAKCHKAAWCPARFIKIYAEYNVQIVMLCRHNHTDIFLNAVAILKCVIADFTHDGVFVTSLGEASPFRYP